MIRSLKSWHSVSPDCWTLDQQRYRRHLKTIGPALPTRLRGFVRRYTLHDDHFDSLQVVSSVPSKRDVLIAIQVFRDGIYGTAALLVLHFIGVRGPIAKLPVGRDIMFFDIEVLADTFRMGFALDETKTWSVRFRDFDYYLYDYKNPAEPATTGNAGKASLPSAEPDTRRP